MKKIIRTAAVFAAAAMLFSCGTTDLIVPEVSVTPTSLSAEGTANTVTFTVTANTSWEVTSDAEWLKFFPVGVKGAVKDYTVNVIVPANEGEARTAVITVTCGGIATATLSFNQAATPSAYVTVDNSELDMFARGQTRGMKINSNFDWTAEIEGEWISITPASGKAGETTIVSVSSAENLAQSSREGKIIILAHSPLGDFEKVVPVRQIAANVPLVQFDIDDTLYVDAAGIVGKEIKVTGNFDWTASCEAEWVGFYPKGGAVGGTVSGLQDAEVSASLDIEPNIGLEPRTAEVKFDCNGAAFILTVIQDATPVELNVTDPSTILKAGGKTAFAVESNYPWTASTEAEWLTVSPDNGAAGTFNQVNVTASENTGIVRAAEVTVTAGNTVKKVIVQQDGEEPYLKIDKESAAFGSDGGAVTVSVEANVTVSAVPGESWVSVTSEGDVYTVSVAANPYAAKRSAKVLFKGAEADVSAELDIEQKGNDPSVILSEDFSWLHYGSTIFYQTDGETRYDYWTADEQNRGWTSSIVPGAGTPCLYARDGFVKLGKTKYAGDLISPKLSEIVGTENVTVSFYAVGYAREDGVKDDSLLTVSVIGPGTVSQSSFLIDNWPNVAGWYDSSYDPWGENVAKRSFTITGATAETQVKFLGGADYSLAGVGTTKNRIFIDNVEVRRSAAELPMTGLDKPVKWLFNVDDTATSGPMFRGGDGYPAKEGTGSLNFVFLPENTALDVNAKEARVVGGTGEPYLTGVFPGDYWEWSVPVKNFKSGTKVEFYGILRASGTGMKYWRMQYRDGDVWKDVGTLATETVTYNDQTAEVTYTHQLNNTKKLLINEVMLFEKAIPDGNVLIRFTCAANWQASGKGSLAAPNGGTVRFSCYLEGQASEDYTDHSPYIRVAE